MQSVAPSLAINLFKTRNFLFFAAVMLMHWTLPRPAPADVIFLAVLYLSIVINPAINSRFLVFFTLVFVWTICVFFSSIHVIHDTPVQFQLLAHTFVVVLGVTACLVAISWREVDFDYLIKVYLVSACLTGLIGIYGFGTGNDYLLWDGRAKALFDEPIAFGAFLLPGVFAAMYLLSRGEGVVWPLFSLGVCTLGVLLSFSRAAIFSMVLFAPVYFVVLNRRNFARASAYLLIGLLAASAVLAVVFVSSDTFQAKVLDRLTIAKPYDSGQGGRFDRYYESIPLILENPTGLGMLEINKYFTEPVHDIFISSFVNYGWLAGVVWILLTLLSFRIAFENQRASGSPAALWVSFSLLGQLPCAILQQVEHWRHLWMFLGLLWGFNIRNFATAVKGRAQFTPPQYQLGRYQ